MNAGRVAIYAAIATAVSWALKAFAIWSAGGLDRSSLEGPLWALGMISMLITFVALGVHAVRTRQVWLRVVSGIAAGVIGLFVFFFVEEWVGSLVDESAGWVREEVGLWGSALLLLILAFAVTRGRKTTAA